MQQLFPIFIFLLALNTSVYAQFKYKIDRKHINFSAAYYASLDLPSEEQKFRHGATIAVSYSLINKAREKVQRRNDYVRIVDRDIYAKMNVSIYNRKNLHAALGISVGPAFRVTIPEGMFFEFDGQIGYLRTFLKGDHYTFENGEISSTRLLGNNLVSLQGNGLIGWNFQKSNDYPAALFFGVGIMSYFPNNDKWLFQPQLQIGATFIFVRLKEEYQ